MTLRGLYLQLVAAEPPVGDRLRHHGDDDGLDDRHDFQRREGLLLNLHGAKAAGDPAVADETGWFIVPFLVDVIKCVDKRGWGPIIVFRGDDDERIGRSYARRPSLRVIVLILLERRMLRLVV